MSAESGRFDRPRPPLPALYPLCFEPQLKGYPWGGHKLAALGRALPQGPTAESWEISAHPLGPTPVLEGALAGHTLAELNAAYGAALVGERNRPTNGGDRFPLLIKLLDAAEWLSIQVHPSDDYERLPKADRGKTEMWVILSAEPEAEILLGLKKGVDRPALQAAVATGSMPDLLHRVAARPGDAFFLTPGTLHAIGPGIVLTEIQQSSDVTYRLFDWGREPANGEERPLHVDDALAVADFDQVELGPVVPEPIELGKLSAERLARCKHFETHRLTLQPSQVFEGEADGSTFEAWAVLSGAIELEWEAQGARPPIQLEAVRWMLVPAALGRFRLVATETATLLRVFTPRLPGSADGIF